MISTFPGDLQVDGEGLSSVFARTVASSFPVTGTSTSYAYRFNPATDALERLAVPHGPVFSERARSLAKGTFNVELSYLYLDYDQINGHDLDHLVSNPPNGSQDYIAACGFSPPAPFCEPLLGQADIDLEAQIVGLAATYGVTSSLDVNVYLPIVRTFVRSATTFTGPDPRAMPNPLYAEFGFSETASESSTGVGDLLVRAKYVFMRAGLADLAAGLNVSLPTGDRDDFQGTGDAVIAPALYASRTFAERVEPHFNLSFALDANDIDRSQARYSVGADVRLVDWLTLNGDFLGRSEFTTPDTIDRAVFVQIERSDLLTFSTGLKVAPLRRFVGFLNLLLPLNDDGLRADVVLVAGIQVSL